MTQVFGIWCPGRWSSQQLVHAKYNQKTPPPALYHSFVEGVATYDYCRRKHDHRRSCTAQASGDHTLQFMEHQWRRADRMPGSPTNVDAGCFAAQAGVKESFIVITCCLHVQPKLLLLSHRNFRGPQAASTQCCSLDLSIHQMRVPCQSIAPSHMLKTPALLGWK